MTLLELKTEAASRLNLTSPEALTRLGSYLNQRYRRLTSSLGLSTSRRGTATISTSIGIDTVTFTIEKIEIVYIASKDKLVYEFPFEEYRRMSVTAPRSGTPEQYGIKKVTPSTVTVALYPTPDAVITLSADGLLSAATMVDGDTPNIPTDFQDILTLGAMSDELFKMEKYDLAKDFQKQYEERASDLRLFLAKTSFISLAETDIPGGLIVVPRKRWQA